MRAMSVIAAVSLTTLRFFSSYPTFLGLWVVPILLTLMGFYSIHQAITLKKIIATELPHSKFDYYRIAGMPYVIAMFLVTMWVFPRLIT